MKKISLLGATGSIGLQCLEVIRGLKNYRVISLSAHSNYNLLLKQIKEFKPAAVCITDRKTYAAVKNKSGKTKILAPEKLNVLAQDRRADIVMVATSGSSALIPIYRALKKGKTAAIANKEPLVMAGDILMKAEKKYSGKIIPVDSEHSAIFHCLKIPGITPRKIYITSSGGALLAKKHKKITPEAVLNHPVWKMGKKITVDSSTGMNKGFEVIEAHHLFGIPFSKIEVILHPQAVVHGIIEHADGSSLAYLSPPDMKIPIKYALTHPHKKPSKNFTSFKNLNLTFGKFPKELFPCFSIAVRAGKKGGIYPAVLCGANETAVEAFLRGKIPFEKIPGIIKKTLAAAKPMKYSLENVLKAEERAKKYAEGLL